MSATSTKTHSASSKSSRKVAFAENASLDPESRDESALDFVDLDPGDLRSALRMADLPPAPTTAGSDRMESAITIYTPGDQLVHIPQLGGLRRDSCEWTNTNLPCINKVASHLAALQRQLEEPREIVHSAETGRLEGIIGPTPGRTIKVTSLTNSPGLEVIDEVKALIDRLETDRRQTVQAYQREVERVKLLQVQVDKVERRRLYILPRAVQLEHEACAQDIYELKWDLFKWAEEKKGMERKVASAMEKNIVLQNSIQELTTQCPSIKEKLDIDKGSLEGISSELKESKLALDYTQDLYQRAQLRYKKVKAELEAVHVEMNEAKNKSSLADGRAEAERQQLLAELDNIRNTLSGVQSELKDAEDINATHNADMAELNKAIAKSQQEGEELDIEMKSVMKAEQQSQRMVDEAKIDLLEVAENIKARRRANKRLSEQMTDKKTELEERDRKQQRTLRFDKSMLREALQTTVKMEREIIDFKKELTVSIKKARDDEKATSRAQAELKHLDQQLQVVVEEVQKLAEVNTKRSVEAHRTEEDIVNTETALRNSLTMLRKTLQDELQAKTNLSTKMESEAVDFAKYQADSTKKLARTQKKKDDLEVVHTKYSKKTDALAGQVKAIHDERDKLQAEIDHTSTTFTAEKADLEKQIATLKPEEKQVHDEAEEAQKAINDLQWRSDCVNKKIQETTDATKVVMKIQKQTDDSIEDLGKQIEAFDTEFEEGQNTEKELQSNLDHIRDNQLLLRNQHKARVDKRVSLFKELKDSVEELIEENVVSSAKYNYLQNKHVTTKNNYQRVIGKRLDLEIGVNEITKGSEGAYKAAMIKEVHSKLHSFQALQLLILHVIRLHVHSAEYTVSPLGILIKQVAELQKRMHKALVSYYMHRGYHNRIVLTDFGKGAAVNLRALEKIHRNLFEVINKTDGYLDKHGSGVSRKQPRIPTPDLKKAETDLSRLPILIETPPPLRESVRASDSVATSSVAAEG